MRYQTGRCRNRLLMAFPPEVLARLSPQLEPVELRRQTILVQAGMKSPYILFPDYGLVSLVKTMSDGRSAEISFTGPEGLIGVPALLGIAEPEVDAIVQLDGWARRLCTAALSAEVAQSPPLHRLIHRYFQYWASVVSQTAACNRLHTLHQRCCRWLLIAQDSVQAPSFALTHEHLALMLGVNRPRLSITLKALQHAGMIRCGYASITIVDRAALEDDACECYETLLRELDQLYQSHKTSSSRRSEPASKKSLLTADFGSVSS
jgi:CRP-like cAMP-binding protein